MFYVGRLVKWKLFVNDIESVKSSNWKVFINGIFLWKVEDIDILKKDGNIIY